MTLLKHEPSAQIPWQKTMLGFAELLTVETSSAFAAVKLPKNEAPANAALVDRNVERLTLLRVLIMVRVCAPPTTLTTHSAICGGICRSCRCCAKPRSRMVAVEPL